MRIRTIALALLALGISAAPAPAAARKSAPSRAEVVPFIHDDYPRALAEARRRHVPIFIDAWAPW